MICFRKVDDDAVDPYLFDEDFSPAVSTGLIKVRHGWHLRCCVSQRKNCMATMCYRSGGGRMLC